MMLNTIFATKGAMSQAWTKDGQRLPITKCLVDQNVILGTQKIKVKSQRNSTFKKQPCLIYEIGYGKKKLKNTPKPLRAKIKQSGFSFGFKQIKGIKVLLDEDDDVQDSSLKPGQTVDLTQVLAVGDIVKVQGTSKGRGFTGSVKRHKVAGGPRTHGQRDRERAIGSIGASADPSRVFPGKKMPGHHGSQTVTVKNLTVAHVDPDKNEVWLSGPIPGHLNSIVQITKTGQKKDLTLDPQASGIEQEPEASKVNDKHDQEIESTESQPETKAKTEDSHQKNEQPDKQAETTQDDSTDDSSDQKESSQDQKENKQAQVSENQQDNDEQQDTD